MRLANNSTIKSRLSHDSRLQKTNYLKTNLLKQIKKISFTQKFLILSCKKAIPLSRLQKYYISKYLPSIYVEKMICVRTKYQKRGMDFGFHPSICYVGLAKLYYSASVDLYSDDYIMPPMPGAPPIGMAGSFSGLSTIRHSVVRNIPAILAAFSKATRATLAGSMTPASRRSS